MDLFFNQLRIVVQYALLPPILVLLSPNFSSPAVKGISFIPTPTIIQATLTPTPQPTITPTNTPIPPTSTPTILPTVTPIPITSQQFDQWFTNYSHQYSIDRQKLWLIAVCESNLKPNARNGDYIGLYQFSKNTWISTRGQMNQDPNPDLRYNPEESIKTAAFKISTVGLSAWPHCGKQ